MAIDFFNNSRQGFGDLAVQGVGNWMLTGQAAKSPDLRWSWRKDGQQRTLYSDYRFAGTIVGGLLHAFGGRNSMWSRGGYDFAAMNAHSLIGTERIRRAAQQSMNNGGGAAPVNQGTLAPPVDPQQLTQGAPAGSAFQNFAYAGSYA